MQPLYCYKIVTKSNPPILQRFVIDDYEIKKLYSKQSYCFNARSYGINQYSNECIDESKLDRFVTNKVYTFDPDINYIYSVITETLEANFLESKKEVKKCKDKLEMWKSIMKESNHEE